MLKQFLNGPYQQPDGAALLIVIPDHRGVRSALRVVRLPLPVPAVSHDVDVLAEK